MKRPSFFKEGLFFVSAQPFFYIYFKYYLAEMANTSINCLTSILEPFGTSDLANTPLYLNVGETMFVQPNIDTNINLDGDEDYVYDFDANNLIKDVMPVVTDNKPYAVAFPNKGIDRYITLSVYDKVPYINVQLTTSPKITNNNFLSNSITVNNNDGYIYIINDSTIKVYDNTMTLINTDTFSGFYINSVVTQTHIIILTESTIHNYNFDLSNHRVYNFGIGNDISVCGNFLALSNSVDDNIYIYDIVTNNIVSTFLTGQGNSKCTSNDIETFYSVNTNTNRIDIINTNTLNHTFINLSRPTPLNIKFYNNRLFVRYYNIIDVYDATNYTFEYTINTTLPDYFGTSMIFNKYNDEGILFLHDNSKCIITKFDTNTGIVSDVKKTVDQLFFIPKLNDISNTLTYFYINPLNNTKNVINVSATNFNQNYNIQTNTNISNIVQITDNLSYFYGISEFYTVTSSSTISNINVRGKMITSASKTFQVYEFPKIIDCVDVAAYQEIVLLSVNDDLDAELYTWYVNNVLIGTGKSINYIYGADIKSTVKCVIKNGYITKTLTKNITLAKNNEANNFRYDDDITKKLVFFNKEGDMINMDYDSENNKWISEQYFDRNSADTYKTIGINIMEHVGPVHLESNNNLLLKNQIFNEYGFEFNNGGYSLEILDYKVVDKKSNTKKIYTNTSKLKKGYEIEINGLYKGVITSQNVLSSYSLSELNTSVDETCTILDVTKDYILVYSATNNAIFNETYVHGTYRDSNNTQINISKGIIKVNNTIKLKNVSNYNTDWNEPSYVNGLYENKPLSIVNPSKNNNNKVVYYKKNMISKYHKQYICDIPDFGDISFNILNEKVEIGTSLVTIIPKNSYNDYHIFIWDKTLSKDYTPSLLKKDTKFSFYETSNNTFIANKIEIASNLLKPITNTQDGYQIKISNNFVFDLTINKSVYNIKYTDFPAVTIQEIIKQVSIFINNLDKVTSFYDDTTIYVYPINNSHLSINNNINTTYINGCLSNKPNKILDNNNIFVDISNQYGYTHFDNKNDSYNIYTHNNEWLIIPSDKKIVYVTSLNNTVVYSSQEYTGYLDDNIFTLSFNESYGTDKNIAIDNFINNNYNVFSTIGLKPSVDHINSKVIFEQQLLSQSNVDYIEPLFTHTVNNVDTDILVLSDDSVLDDEINNNISVLNTRKILFDKLIGTDLIININGIDYKSDIIESTAPNLNTEYTLLNWGLTMFEDTNNIIENGTHFYENLESQGILVCLSKTDNTYDILNIETRYPNQELIINTNQSVLYHHSDILFNKIVNKLSITISNKIYIVNFNNTIQNTLSDFVIKYRDVLLNINIIVENNDDKLSFYTNKDIDIKYSVYAGISNTSPYIIHNHRNHNLGCVIASNEVRNLTDDFESYKFSTGMILNIENSMFYNNNQEYNILYVDNESLVLSYQGPFWRSDDKLGYIYTRKNFEWISFMNIVNSNNTSNNFLTGVFTNDNIEIQDNFINPTYTIFDPSCNKLIVLHNNNLPQDKASIVDLNTNTISGSVNLGSQPVHGVYNSETQSVYIINQNSVKITEIKNGVLYNEILIGYQANRIICDYTNNKMYVSLLTENAVLLIDMFDYNNQSIIYLSPNALPSKMVIDETNRTLYVLSSDNMIYTIDMELYTLSGSFNTGPNPIDIKINSNRDVYTANSNDNTVTYINNNLAYHIQLDSSPISVAMINDKLYVLTNINKIYVIDTYTNTISDTIITNNVTKILAVYFTNKLFLYNNINSTLGYIDLTKDENIITNINYDNINNTEYTVFLGYTDNAVVATSVDKIHIILEAANVTQIQNYSNFIPQSLNISLTTRDFIRYPRERYSDDNYKNISFDISLNETPDIFMYEPNISTLSPIYNKKYTIPFLDDVSLLSITPTPLQIFAGFKGVYDTVSSNVLTIKRNKYIQNDISQDVIFEPYDNSVFIKNFNFIEAGYSINDTIEITNLDGYMNNAGLQCKINEVYINKIIVTTINKNIIYENLTNAKMHIEMLPQTIAEITLLGETVTEDERYRVHTSNLGCDIDREDIYIFKEYDISEKGIDWIYMNNKRKEMLLNRNDIYNYIGSYKALVNSVNYFGYNDISLHEYYYNKNDKSYKKLEIPKIFDKSTQYTSKDYIKQLLPNDKYKKTNLFNLTYDITDSDGNYILAYSLDEIIIKLLGLKKWLQNNVMPLGMKIKDITGVSTTNFTNQISASNKASYKYNITDTLTPMDFDVIAILQPLKNNSKTYNIHINFINEVSEYFSVKIKTFKNVDNKYRYVQNFSYYKTDNSSLNITCDINTDPYIMIETESDNGYGATYNVKKVYSLLSNSFIN